MQTKQVYIRPEIELIKLDREISLQLASDSSPMGEPEWISGIKMDLNTKGNSAIHV